MPDTESCLCSPPSYWYARAECKECGKPKRDDPQFWTPMTIILTVLSFVFGSFLYLSLHGGVMPFFSRALSSFQRLFS